MKKKHLIWHRRNAVKKLKDEEIKIKFNSRRNKAIILVFTIFVGVLMGSYTVLEYMQSQNRIILTINIFELK